MASWPRYNLTTYHQYTEILVDNTINVLLEALKEPRMPIAHQFLQGRLIERGTVKELS
jgi:DNA-binding LacI/PurR family transcriptional regulator